MEIVSFNKDQVDIVTALRALHKSICLLDTLTRELGLLRERELNLESIKDAYESEIIGAKERNQLMQSFCGKLVLDGCDADNLWGTLTQAIEEASTVAFEAFDVVSKGRCDLRDGDDLKAFEKAFKEFSAKAKG